MLGSLVKVLSVVGTLFFCLFLFLRDSLLISWFCLEMSALCLVPAFFLGGSSYSLSALFCYLIVMGVSSCFIVLGVSFSVLLIFAVVGFIIKFGLFPFRSWVYQVLTMSN